MGLQLLLLGVVIGANNFATALALGALGQSARWARILSVFAAFEFTVPLVGIWIGQQVAGSVVGATGWLGPVLLAGLGVWTLYEATRPSADLQRLARWLTSWRGLVLIAAGMSLDNLVLGFGLGLGGMPPLLLATTIMVFSVGFAAIGLRLGRRARRDYETISEVITGVLLILLGAADWLGWF
jgi:putative Mn2+ efflux pump MntP